MLGLGLVKAAFERLAQNVNALADTVGLANQGLRDRLSLELPSAPQELPAPQEVPALEAKPRGKGKNAA